MRPPSCNGKSPPLGPKSMQNVTMHGKRVPPTGPRMSGLPSITNSATPRMERPAYGTTQTGVLTETLPPRLRPCRWKILCRNTVPYDKPYPPPSSQSTISRLCHRGVDCDYGHHGDIYLDAVEMGGLYFEYGIPHHGNLERKSFDISDQSDTWEHNENTSYHWRNGGEAWMDKRLEWRKRQAALGPYAENSLNFGKWEDNYKTKDLKRRKEDAAERSWIVSNGSKRMNPVRLRDHGWGEYSMRRLKANTGERKNWQWGWERFMSTSGNDRQDNLRFQQSLSSSAQGSPPRGMETECVTALAPLTGETTSAMQYLIPPYQNGHGGPQKTCSDNLAKPHTLPTSSLLDSSFDPLATAGSCPAQASDVQRKPRPEHLQASARNHQHSRDTLFPLGVTQASPSASYSRGRSYPHTSFGGKLDVYHNNPQVFSNSNQQQQDLWISLGSFNYPMAQERCGSTVDTWYPYPINVQNTDYARGPFYASQNPLKTSNTPIVPSFPSSSHPYCHNSHPRGQQNHILNQITMLLSIYPSCPNQEQVKKFLHAFAAPGAVEGDTIKSLTLMTDNLQTVFHRLALSISKQEHDVVAGFQAEVWGVLGWLSGGGGSVAVLKHGESVGVSNPELGMDRSSCENGYNSVKSGGITVSSGQITLHGAGEKVNEVVVLTPGHPAILSPVLPQISLPSHPELGMDPVVLSGPPILPAKTKKELELPLSLEYQPFTPPCGEAPTPLSTTIHPQSALVKEGRGDTTHFFLSDQMEAYLQDSYEKVLRVQINISLKWRRIRKVFEREWCSGISRFARNGVVARALWNVHAMEETDWLTTDSPTALFDCRSDIGIKWNINQHRPSSAVGSTAKGIPSEEGAPIEMVKVPEENPRKQVPRTPLRAVWDRRGLCQEVEPVALSNEGSHFLELVEKMCLEKVLEYTEMEKVLREDSAQPISLPPPPESSLFCRSECITTLECQSSPTDQHLRSAAPVAGCKSNSNQPQDWFGGERICGATFIDGSGKISMTNEQDKTGTREAAQVATGPIPPTQGSFPLVGTLSLYGAKFINFLIKVTNVGTDRPPLIDGPLQSLIHNLQLEPRIISSPVLDLIFLRSGPLYFKSALSDGAFENNIDMTVRAKFLEMCNLDRSLFMGYVVLEILNIWEEHRKDVTQLGWRYPEVDRESMFSERLKRFAEATMKPTSLELKKLEPIVDPPQPPPKWADVASGRCKVEGRPVFKTTPASKHAPLSHPEHTVKSQKSFDVTNAHERPPEIPNSRPIDSKHLYTEILKGKVEPKKNAQPSGSSVSAPIGGSTDESNTIGKRYKAKKEKKRHGFDLDDDVNYHKVEIIPWNGKQQVEFSSQQNPPTMDSQIVLPEQSKEEVSKDSWISGQGHDFEALKSRIMHEIDQEIKAEKEAVGEWFQRLQMCLWTFNEGLGVEFVEIPEHHGLDSEKSTETEPDHEPVESAGCVMGDLEKSHDTQRVELLKKPGEMAERGEARECSMKRVLSE